MPFTTYIIPESTNKETTGSGKWLWIVVDQPLSAEQTGLLQKICEALKADFSRDTNVLICSPYHEIHLSDHGSKDARLVLSFGIEASSLGIWIDLKGQGMRMLDSFTFIQTVGLEDLIHQPLAKKALWSSMQNYLHTASN